ncbi:hypothetical protein DSCW_26890 [Desulfosarcina widdelii]|uniref:Uncharacterized protein n=1 Tax=Desulfosarcina widdelii TaxID=947919 RepID=A0A5K7YZX9_9BACT|nr:hypothetical protein DSCW_26890 [Desulfosarcina widdelii]
MMDDFTEQDAPYILLLLLRSQAFGHHFCSRKPFFVLLYPFDLCEKLFCSIIQKDFFFIHSQDLCCGRKITVPVGAIRLSFEFHVRSIAWKRVNPMIPERIY